MLTQDDLAQIKQIVVEPLSTKIDGVEQRLNAKLDKFEEAFGDMLHEILNVVSDHHAKLEHRVERIEDHLGLPKPQ